VIRASTGPKRPIMILERPAALRSVRFLFGALALLLTCGCTVDTELGVAADFQSATVRVSGAGDTTVVAVDLVVDFRVGEHAQGGARIFVVSVATLFVDSTPTAEIRVDDSRTLSPGSSTTVTLTGETRPGAHPSARDLLCAGSPTVQVLIQWSEAPTMDPSMMMIDMADFTTRAIVCE